MNEKRKMYYEQHKQKYLEYNKKYKQKIREQKLKYRPVKPRPKNDIEIGKSCIGQTVYGKDAIPATIVSTEILKTGKDSIITIQYDDGETLTGRRCRITHGNFVKPLTNVIKKCLENGWKFIPGTNNRYIINTQGEIKIAKGKNLIGKQKTQYLNKSGYYVTGIRTNQNKDVPKLVHRLVAETFIRPILTDEQVNHIDGVKTNNSLYNLEIIHQSLNKQKYLHLDRCGLNENEIAFIKQYCFKNKISLYNFIKLAILKYLKL